MSVQPLNTARARAAAAWGMVVEGEVTEPSPGWWVCPSCGRRRDRDGDRARVRLCAGSDGRMHHPAVMAPER